MKIHELVQGSPEWQAFRLTHHGASEAAAMLGLSKKTTRSELLRIKHTGTPKEFSDWVQVNILDYGHQVEALARPLVEEIIGEDLYPVTTSNEDEGGNLSASCDGLTMLYDTAFEHKQWNEALAASVRAGILPEEHMPQCQQIMLVTGAARVIFVVSDGTPGNLVWVEVRPDPEWFDRIRAGWAQFDRDLADYVLPEAKPAIVAEPVQALPAVSVQVSGALTVAENFTVFEQALRQFLDERLIREPQTDQDFADLDLQIKALKRAEDALDAAEAQMLAQVSGVDAAKRAKDALHKLTRDNRLMAEKLLESEKKRRREEKIEAARKAFADHLTELQREITELRLDVPAPDFAAVIKGLKTLASVQDKLDTALANGKIAADQKAGDLRTKLAWVGTNAAEHRALLPDLQQLAVKPLDDFKLAITARIDAHKRAEAERLEADRARIRKEEAERLEREAKDKQEREAAAAQQRSLDEAEDAAIVPLHPANAALENSGPDSLASYFPSGADASALLGVDMAAAPAAELVTASPQCAAHSRPMGGGGGGSLSTATLKLGQINERLAPIALTADGLATLGFPHVATDKSAKLYRERDFPRICAALVRHIQTVQAGQPAPATQAAPATTRNPERTTDMATRAPAAAFDDAADYQHIPMKEVESHKIKAVGYDEATRTLAVTFQRGAGAIYHYPNVEPQVYADFIGAESLGSFFGAHLQSLPFKKFHPEQVAA